jgi:hypothetical protein
MKKRMVGIVIAATLFIGCSSTQQAQFQAQLQTVVKNLTAEQCANPVATVANIPAGFLTPAQMAQLGNLLCAGAFGTQAAPTTAPGMNPVLK